MLSFLCRVAVHKKRQQGDQRYTDEKAEKDLFFAVLDQLTEHGMKRKKYKSASDVG